jgi:acyl-CoA thioesterase-1
MSQKQLIVLVIGVIGIAVIVAVALHQGKYPAAPAANTNASTIAKIRYLPLGDSYTIGESVSENDRWPNQLTSRAQKDGKSIAIVANPSVTGYTTQDLINNELPQLVSLKPNFVTILIGVNDYVQGVDAGTFTKHLNYILDVVQKQLPNPKNIVLVTIPDYGLTPTGAQYGSPQNSEAGIKAFNMIIAAAAQTRGLPLADIFPTSQGVTQDTSLTAADGLHPSGKQYVLWTNIIYAASRPLLTN